MEGKMRAPVHIVIPAISFLIACGDGSGRRGSGDEDGIHTAGIDTESDSQGEGDASATSGASGSASASASGTADDGVDDGDDDGLKFDLGDQPEACVNLECDQVQCDDPGVTTTVRGTVYDPSGQLELYNVQVYIPNAAVGPIVDDLICDQCDAELSGSPLVSAVTDTEGKFVLENVPVGANIPLVMQVGKWRRQVTIPNVQPCQDNVLADPDLTRLPRSKAEGDLPRIALTTGGCDPLFCLLRRLAIADEEFGVQGSDARIHFYRGANGSSAFDGGFGASPGASFPNAQTTLWDNGWENYDIVMLSCECSTQPTTKNGHRVKMRDYLDVGGRVFGTHYHYNWMQGDAPADLQSVATFSTEYWDNGTVTADIDMTFPKGDALADWMLFVGGSTVHGRLPVYEIRANTASLSAAAQQWIYWNHQNANRTVTFSFNAPINAPEEEQCGRKVFSDMHVSGLAGNANGNFPSACNNTALTPQEKVLIFMLFDLSACINPDSQPPPG
jgi:hypothetical protein